MEALRARFATFGHSPSEEHWKGLAEIARELEAMALGEARREFTYSALPTGMGKTSAIMEFTRIILNDPTYADVGIIIFLNQLSQIGSLVEQMELKPHQFAVFVGKSRPEFNAMGRCSGVVQKDWPKARRLAQVLFVTQQKLSRLPPFLQSFDKLFRYHANADATPRPRSVRIWDEAIMPAEPLAISAKDARTFAGTLFKFGHTEAAERLRDWLEAKVDGKSWVTTVPSLTTYLKLTTDPLTSFEGEDEIWSDDTLGSKLLALSGRDVRVHSDACLGETVISYRDFLPFDLAPLLILDASGSLRLVYRLWKKGRGGIRELPSPGKTYRNLTIKHWNRSAGKAAYRRGQNQDDLAEGVFRAFRMLPLEEKMLVLTHKEGITDKAHGEEIKPYANLELGIRSKVRAWGGKQAEDRLSFITWGKHMASNEFANIRHVAVVGLLQYSQAVNAAYYRAAFGASADREVSNEEINDLRMGEIAHHLFQGVGRGAVRKAVDGDVPAGCVLWIVFSTYKHTMWVPPDVLSHVFPGATVETWEPLGVELKGGNLKSNDRPLLVEKLMARLGDQETVRFEVRDLEDSELSYQWAARLMKDPAVRQAIATRGVVLSEDKRKVPRAGSTAIATVYTLTRNVEGIEFEEAA